MPQGFFTFAVDCLRLTKTTAACPTRGARARAKSFGAKDFFDLDESSTHTATHTWIEVAARRWCLACGSYQARSGGVWRDSLVGPWPGYSRTDTAAHGGAR